MSFNSIEERAVIISNFIINYGATVRAAAKVFGVSKSTVFEDVTDRIYKIDRALHSRVRSVLQYNKKMSTIRGSIASKRKRIFNRHNK